MLIPFEKMTNVAGCLYFRC